MSLTPLVDIASGTQAANGSLTSTFRFTSADDTINGMSATIQADDTLIDGSTTDNDVFNITLTGGTMGAMTAVNIETVNVSFASGAANVASFTNFSGLKTVNVSGTVDGTVLNADGATINIADYGRVASITTKTLAGTTTGGNAETMNVSVSGATFGTTASTQTSIVINTAAAPNAGTLETLNITSAGSAANVFSLASGGNATFGTINVLGTTDATIRVVKADVSGVTIDGSKGTGSLSLSLDVDGSGATSVNGANWTGVNNIVLRDSATASAEDAASLLSLKSGHNIVVANSVGDLDVTVQGATFSALADKATLTLNGTSTTAGVTVGKYDLQNVKALDLVSTGLPSSTATTAENTVTTLNGDFTTIKISGDTSLAITNLDIDDTQTATSATTARVVTLDASSMTGNAFVNITAVNDAKVSYNITGTAKDDTITLNNSGGKITVSAGKNTLKGGDGKDTIIGGSGDDLIVITFGADTVTGGAGKNTFDINATGEAAVQGVFASKDLTNVTGSTALDKDDQVIVTINGDTFTQVFDTNTKATVEAFVESFGGTILATHGVAVSEDDKVLTFTGKADGTAFTASVSTIAAGAATTVNNMLDATATKVAAAAKDVDTTITDFAKGDVIDLAGLSLTGGYVEGAATDLGAANNTTDYGVVVLTSASFATVAEASAALNVVSNADKSALVVFLNSTTGQAQAYLDDKLNADAVAGGNDSVVFTFENITTLQGIADTFSADSFII